ncbi:MAG TPA: PAS domain S-box protein, partial [Spirochaetota bacterium]|nr:PAS domain S-box protein [Spirochaetota bacterium]
GLRSVCIVPITHHGVVIASFNLASRTVDRIPATFISGFEAIAYQIGAALVRIRAEEDLRESEDRYRAIIENSILGVVVGDMNGLILVNRSMADMLGYSVEELLGMKMPGLLAIIHPDDRENAFRRFSDRQEGREPPAGYRYRFIRKNGDIIWTDVATALIRYGGRRAQIAMVADITERVQAEERLRESSIRLSMLSDNLPEGLVYQIDTGVDGRERRFTYISAGVEPLHGITMVDALNDAQAVYGHILGEDRPILEVRERAAIAAMTSFRAEVRVRLPSGEVRWRYFASAPRRLENGHLVWDGIELDITDWKLADDELKHERDRAQQYFDIAGVMMVLIDADGTIRLANKKACEVLCCEEEDITGKNWFDVAIPEREREFVRGVLRELMAGNVEPQNYVENRVISKRDGERLIAWHNIVLRDDAGRITGTLSSGEDITDRRRAEDALRSMSERLRLTQEAAGAGSWDWDLHTGQIEWSPRMFELFGLEAGTVAASLETWERALHPDDREKAGKKIEQALLDRSDLFNEYRVVWPDGETRWINAFGKGVYDESGKPVRMMGICIDVTGRVLAEEAKKKSDQMFRAVIENSYDAVTMITADGTIIYDSPSIMRILGYRIDDRLGRNVTEFVVPEERQNLADGLRAFAVKFGAVMHYTALFVHKDGSTRWVEGVRTNLLNDPLVRAIVVNYRDITERKEAEERLFRSLHEKDVLLAEVHHRVKNNLQSVISLFNINEERIRDDRSREVFHDIQGKVYSMALIHEMLYRSGDFTAIDMGPYIRELVNEIFRAYSTSPDWITHQIRISEIRLGLRQAIPCGLLVHELVLNIVKHAFSGMSRGIIMIEMLKRADGGIDLAIGDNGTGLPVEISEEEGGSMGFTLVRGWVRQMRATMKIDRAPGNRYIIHIPHSEEKAGGQ